MSDISEDNDKSEYIDHPIEVDHTNFDSFITLHKKAIIDCWAGWCLPCKMSSPIVDKLAKEYAGQIVFGKIDVEHNRDMVKLLNIQAIPTFLFFNNGHLVAIVAGTMSEKKFKEKINKVYGI